VALALALALALVLVLVQAPTQADEAVAAVQPVLLLQAAAPVPADWDF
jgi:hypothetical protein